MSSSPACPSPFPFPRTYSPEVATRPGFPLTASHGTAPYTLPPSPGLPARTPARPTPLLPRRCSQTRPWARGAGTEGEEEEGKTRGREMRDRLRSRINAEDTAHVATEHARQIHPNPSLPSRTSKTQHLSPVPGIPPSWRQEIGGPDPLRRFTVRSAAGSANPPLPANLPPWLRASLSQTVERTPCSAFSAPATLPPLLPPSVPACLSAYLPACLPPSLPPCPANFLPPSLHAPRLYRPQPLDVPQYCPALERPTATPPSPRQQHMDMGTWAQRHRVIETGTHKEFVRYSH